jgi:hypothetical protein
LQIVEGALATKRQHPDPSAPFRFPITVGQATVLGRHEEVDAYFAHPPR